MSIFEQVNDDIRAAMLARDKERLEAVRNIKKVLLEAKTAKKWGRGSFRRGCHPGNFETRQAGTRFCRNLFSAEAG